MPSGEGLFSLSDGRVREIGGEKMKDFVGVKGFGGATVTKVRNNKSVLTHLSLASH